MKNQPENFVRSESQIAPKQGGFAKGGSLGIALIDILVCETTNVCNSYMFSNEISDNSASMPVKFFACGARGHPPDGHPPDFV